jgi:hypothetical protein
MAGKLDAAGTAVGVFLDFLAIAGIAKAMQANDRTTKNGKGRFFIDTLPP